MQEKVFFVFFVFFDGIEAILLQCKAAGTFVAYGIPVMFLYFEGESRWQKELSPEDMNCLQL